MCCGYFRLLVLIIFKIYTKITFFTDVFANLCKEEKYFELQCECDLDLYQRMPMVELVQGISIYYNKFQVA